MFYFITLHRTSSGFKLFFVLGWDLTKNNINMSDLFIVAENKVLFLSNWRMGVILQASYFSKINNTFNT